MSSTNNMLSAMPISRILEIAPVKIPFLEELQEGTPGSTTKQGVGVRAVQGNMLVPFVPVASPGLAGTIGSYVLVLTHNTPATFSV